MNKDFLNAASLATLYLAYAAQAEDLDLGERRSPSWACGYLAVQGKPDNPEAIKIWPHAIDLCNKAPKGKGPCETAQRLLGRNKPEELICIPPKSDRPGDAECRELVEFYYNEYYGPDNHPPEIHNYIERCNTSIHCHNILKHYREYGIPLPAGLLCPTS